MPNLEGAAGKEGTSRFRELVAGIVEESDSFPPKEIGEGETLSIIDAIENNEVSIYVGGHPSDRMMDAVTYLLAIYDELKKAEPDQEFIDRTIDELKEYLQ